MNNQEVIWAVDWLINLGGGCNYLYYVYTCVCTTILMKFYCIIRLWKINIMLFKSICTKGNNKLFMKQLEFLLSS